MPRKVKPTPKIFVTVSDVKNFQRNHPGYAVCVPQEEESTLSRVEGEVMMPLDHFAAGMVLPIPGFFVLLFKYFMIVLTMLTPNSITILTGLHSFSAKEVAWTIENVMTLISFVTKEKGVYYAQVRHSKNFGITGYQNAYHGWRSKCIWLKNGEENWPFATVVGDSPSLSFKHWPNTFDIAALYARIGSPYFVLDGMWYLEWLRHRKGRGNGGAGRQCFWCRRA